MYERNPATGRYFDQHALENERTYALFNHLIGLLSLADLSILGLIGSVVMWRIKAKESPFLDDHGREAVNFQISLLLYAFVGSVLIGIITLGFGIPLVLLFLLGLRLYGCIRGAIAANRGEFYRYPMCIRFLS